MEGRRSILILRIHIRPMFQASAEEKRIIYPCRLVERGYSVLVLPMHIRLRIRNRVSRESRPALPKLCIQFRS